MCARACFWGVHAHVFRSRGEGALPGYACMHVCMYVSNLECVHARIVHKHTHTLARMHTHTHTHTSVAQALTGLCVCVSMCVYQDCRAAAVPTGLCVCVRVCVRDCRAAEAPTALRARVCTGL